MNPIQRFKQIRKALTGIKTPTIDDYMANNFGHARTTPSPTESYAYTPENLTERTNEELSKKLESLDNQAYEDSRNHERDYIITKSIKPAANNGKQSAYRTKANSLFGTNFNTAEDVARFQSEHGLTVDGMLGQNTLNKLNELYKKNIGWNQIALVNKTRKNYPGNTSNKTPQAPSLYEQVTKKYPDMKFDKEYINKYKTLKEFENNAFSPGMWHRTNEDNTFSNFHPYLIARNKEIFKRHGRAFENDNNGNYYMYSSDGSGTRLTPETINGITYHTWKNGGIKYGYDPKTKKTYKITYNRVQKAQ